MDHYLRHSSWKLRALAIPVLVYVLFQVGKTQLGQPTSLLIAPFSMVNFGVHEMAHIATGAFPDVVTASAGSFSEIILASTVVGAGIVGRTYFASAISGLWLMYSFRSAGQYMADANAQSLPLISVASATGTGESIHDWHFIFGELGWLPAAELIGGSFVFVGWLIGIASVVAAAWLVVAMYRAQHPATQPATVTVDTPADTPPQHRPLASLYPEPKQPEPPPRTPPQP